MSYCDLDRFEMNEIAKGNRCFNKDD